MPDRRPAPANPATEPMTPQRLERAVVMMAYIVLRHGAVYAPLLERLEQELEAARRREDPMARARRLLDAYTVDGGRKAILDSHVSF